MGAPKQRWTAEEESALKAGVRKHGPGKWRTILKDPEFSGVLCLRSNVDLKDKWRNMSVTANGWGSRDRGRLALKRNKAIRKQDNNPLSIGAIEEFQEDIVDATPLAVSPRTLEISIPQKPFPSLEDLILKAITCLKEPSGSNTMDITMYIEDLYSPPLNFRCMLSTKLEALVAAGKIDKVKGKYRIASSLCTRVTGLLPLEGTQKETSKVENDVKKPTKIEKDDVKPLTKSQIDAELLKVKKMNPQEAAETAARAVAEAEIAIAEAEEAAREAETAEADAEAARLFAEAAMTALRNRSMGKLQMVST